MVIDFAQRKIYLAKGKQFADLDREDLSGLHLLWKSGNVEVASVDEPSPAALAGIRQETRFSKSSPSRHPNSDWLEFACSYVQAMTSLSRWSLSGRYQAWRDFSTWDAPERDQSYFAHEGLRRTSEKTDSRAPCLCRKLRQSVGEIPRQASRRLGRRSRVRQKRCWPNRLSPFLIVQRAERKL